MDHGQVTFASGEKANFNTLPGGAILPTLDHLSDWATGRLLLSDHGYWTITPNFVRYYAQAQPYPNSLVLLSICESLDNNTLADAFLDNGAGTVFGWHHPVLSPFAFTTKDALLAKIIDEGMSTGTAYAALNQAEATDSGVCQEDASKDCNPSVPTPGCTCDPTKFDIRGQADLEILSGANACGLLACAVNGCSKLGDLRCIDGSPASVELCANIAPGCLGWIGQPCANGCMNNQCAPPPCTSNGCSSFGATQCVISTQQTCGDSGAGCLSWGADVQCDDGNPCTVGDTCSGGSCVPGSPTTCNHNGMVDCGEQCDGTADAACPGLCQADCTCGPPPAASATPTPTSTPPTSYSGAIAGFNQAKYGFAGCPSGGAAQVFGTTSVTGYLQTFTPALDAAGDTIASTLILPNGVPVDGVRMEMWTYNGTPSAPLGTLLRATNVPATQISADRANGAPTWFTFDPYSFSSAQQYILSFYRTGAADNSNAYQVVICVGDPYPGQGALTNINGAFTPNSASDIPFQLFDSTAPPVGLADSQGAGCTSRFSAPFGQTGGGIGYDEGLRTHLVGKHRYNQYCFSSVERQWRCTAV